MPFCLYPNIKSIQLLILIDTYWLSIDFLNNSQNNLGECFPQLGIITLSIFFFSEFKPNSNLLILTNFWNIKHFWN